MSTAKDPQPSKSPSLTPSTTTTTNNSRKSVQDREKTPHPQSTNSSTTNAINIDQTALAAALQEHFKSNPSVITPPARVEPPAKKRKISSLTELCTQITTTTPKKKRRKRKKQKNKQQTHPITQQVTFTLFRTLFIYLILFYYR